MKNRRYSKVKALLLDDKTAAHYSIQGKIDMNDTDFKLFMSKKGDWMPPFKGKVAAKLHDNGNYVTVQIRNKEPLRMDYAQLCELQLVMKEYFRFARPHAPKFLRVIDESKSKYEENT